MERVKNNIIKVVFLLSVGVIFLAASTLSYGATYEEAVSYWKFDDMSADDDFNQSSVNYDRWSNYGVAPTIEAGQLSAVSTLGGGYERRGSD